MAWRGMRTPPATLPSHPPALPCCFLLVVLVRTDCEALCSAAAVRHLYRRWATRAHTCASTVATWCRTSRPSPRCRIRPSSPWRTRPASCGACEERHAMLPLPLPLPFRSMPGWLGPHHARGRARGRGSPSLRCAGNAHALAVLRSQHSTPSKAVHAPGLGLAGLVRVPFRCPLPACLPAYPGPAASGTR